MSNAVHPVIRGYADGEISAMQAAGLLGGRSTVADVITMLRQAGLTPRKRCGGDIFRLGSFP